VQEEQIQSSGIHESTGHVTRPSDRKVALHHTPQHGVPISRAVTATQSRHEDTSNSHMAKTAIGWGKPDTLSRTNTALRQHSRDSHELGSPVPVQNDGQLPRDTIAILHTTIVKRKSNHLHMYGVLALLKTRTVRHLCNVFINDNVRIILCKSRFQNFLEEWSEESFHTINYGDFKYWVIPAEVDCKRLLDGEEVAFEKCSLSVRDKFAYLATTTRKRDRTRRQPLTKDVLPYSIPSLLSKCFTSTPPAG
jgi:hypothetical protein